MNLMRRYLINDCEHLKEVVELDFKENFNASFDVFDGDSVFENNNLSQEDFPCVIVIANVQYGAFEMQAIHIVTKKDFQPVASYSNKL